MLENLYKEMEQMRRENLLFESYIKRNEGNTRDDGDSYQRTKKRDKKRKYNRENLLTDEEKYDIATSESDALKKNIDQGKLQSDTILETLRAILDETDMSIQEIRKDAFDFHREILINGENARTGKIEAEKIIKYREDKLRQKDIQIKKFTDKIRTLEGQIVKTEQQIKKKEELGDDLKFIHFHKLQIENKKYVAEIEEKNANQMEEYKKQVTHLNNMKEKLDTLKQSKKDVLIKMEKVHNQILGYKNQQENVAGIVDVKQYVEMKNLDQQLNKQVKNTQRRINILNFKYKKAQKFLKDYQYEDPNMHEMH